MIYVYAYLTAWLLCHTFLLALAIRSDASGGIYCAILLFAVLSIIIRVQIDTRDKDDERD